MSEKLLVVVDMQNDFIDGVLGTPEAQSIVPRVCKKLRSWDGKVVFTLDTHHENYLSTTEGKNLPVEHCIAYSDGWDLQSDISEIVNERFPASVFFTKPTFGSIELPTYIMDLGIDKIVFVGVCTDICVVSNVLMVKAFCPEAKITVDASCCAGATPDKHKDALSIMKSCHIEVINEE